MRKPRFRHLDFNRILRSLLLSAVVVLEILTTTNGVTPCPRNSTSKRSSRPAVAKVRQDALREIESAKIANTKADAEAYRVKAEATAQAESIQKRGDAEAASLRAKGAAIAANPAIVDLIKAEKWNGTATFIPSSAMQVYGPNK